MLSISHVTQHFFGLSWVAYMASTRDMRRPYCLFKFGHEHIRHRSCLWTKQPTAATRRAHDTHAQQTDKMISSDTAAYRSRIKMPPPVWMKVASTRSGRGTSGESSADPTVTLGTLCHRFGTQDQCSDSVSVYEARSGWGGRTPWGWLINLRLNLILKSDCGQPWSAWISSRGILMRLV